MLKEIFPNHSEILFVKRGAKYLDEIEVAGSSIKAKQEAHTKKLIIPKSRPDHFHMARNKMKTIGKIVSPLISSVASER